MHLDLGSTQKEYGIPFAVVPSGQKRLPLAFGTDELHTRHPIDGGDFEVVAGGPVSTCGSR